MWAIFFYILILTCVVVLVLGTHPNFRVLKEADQRRPSNDTNPKVQDYHNTQVHPTLLYIDNICICIFTAEVILKLFMCPNKLRFLRSAFNIIDILCVIPRFIGLLIRLIAMELWYMGNFSVMLSYVIVTSILRLCRLTKLTRHYQGLKILQLTLRSSLKELLLLLILILIGTVFFSTCIYFVELNEEEHFEHIPAGFWWSVVTMTTVGYGDVVPKTALGRVVASLCAISGILITGLSIPVIASNFNHYSRYARICAHISKKKQISSRCTIVRSSQSLRNSSNLSSMLQVPARRSALQRSQCSPDMRMFSNSIQPLHHPLGGSASDIEILRI